MQSVNSIMIIDDDEDDRRLFLEALTEIDDSYNLISAANGAEGLAILKKNKNNLPDYIFLDLNMPIMNGFQCLEQLRKSKELSNIPVIIYTTSSVIQNEERYKRFEPVRFLTKPSRFREIIRSISSLIKSD